MCEVAPDQAHMKTCGALADVHRSRQSPIGSHARTTRSPTSSTSSIGAAVPDVSALDVLGKYRDDHDGDWHYTTVIAHTDRKLATNADDSETEELHWVRLDDVDSLGLHPGFAKTWPEVRALLEEKVMLAQSRLVQEQ